MSFKIQKPNKLVVTKGERGVGRGKIGVDN